MNKKIFLKAAIILILILFLLALKTPSRILKETEKFMYTKAICSDEVCRDYEIVCEGKKTTKLSPTGFAIKNYNNTLTNLSQSLC